MKTSDRETFHPSTREEWRAWLEENHQRDEGVWLVRYKKAVGKPYVDYDASVEEALCFGWIDGVRRSVDEERTMLYFSPRRAKSNWSGLNKKRITELRRQKKMMPAGEAQVKAAQKDGRWTALDKVEALVVPDDLTEAFERHPGSAEYFEAFPPSAKKGILAWIYAARRPETRARRVEESASHAARNERVKR